MSVSSPFIVLSQADSLTNETSLEWRYILKISKGTDNGTESISIQRHNCETQYQLLALHAELWLMSQRSQVSRLLFSLSLSLSSRFLCCLWAIKHKAAWDDQELFLVGDFPRTIAFAWDLMFYAADDMVWSGQIMIIFS